MDLARKDMGRVGLRKETKSTGKNGKYFCAVVTPNKEKPKEEDVYNSDNLLNSHKVSFAFTVPAKIR